MFKPIIHNLKAGEQGFAECQVYNELITQRPTGGNLTLAEKAKAQMEWKLACNKALMAARLAAAE